MLDPGSPCPSCHCSVVEGLTLDPRASATVWLLQTPRGLQAAELWLGCWCNRVLGAEIWGQPSCSERWGGCRTAQARRLQTAVCSQGYSSLGTGQIPGPGCEKLDRGGSQDSGPVGCRLRPNASSGQEEHSGQGWPFLSPGQGGGRAPA